MPRPPSPTINAPLALAIGVRVRERRKAKGLTLRELAEKSGLSNPYLSQLENGHSIPGAESALIIADALDVRIGWLIEGGPESLDTAAQAMQEPGAAPISIPAGLASYAATVGLGWRDMATLLDLRRVIMGHRRTGKGSEDGEGWAFDWQRLHGAVGPWLGDKGDQ